MKKDKKEAGGNRELSSNLPDLGMFLLNQGIGSSSIVIPGVPFINFYELAGDKDTLISSVACDIQPTAHLGTFDFKGQYRTELISCLREEFGNYVDGALNSKLPVRIDLPSPITLAITAVVGEEQNNGMEQFAPLVVIEVKKTAFH